jgi:FK506-binding nuclear protein
VEPKAKVQKMDKKEKAKQNGMANGKEAPAKEGKKDKKAAAAQQTPAPEKGQKRVLPGGVVVEELRVGSGMEAKNGKKVQVYYEGRLKTNNKVFDSTKSGPGFKFGLGKGDVIKGWDLGVVGMKVGGKRRLTCPPAVAYGAKGSPPVIPPNSTLVFDVELKNVF